MATARKTRPTRPKGEKGTAPGVPEALRCRFEADGARCERTKLTNSTFCRQHRQEHGDEAQARENAAVGGAVVGDKMRKELDELLALRAELAALKAANAATTEPAAARAANVDPEIEGDRLAAELRGEKLPPNTATGKPPVFQPPTGLPAEAAGMTLAMEMLQKAREETKARAADRAAGRKRRGLAADEGRVPIELQIEMPAQLDPSAMVDDYGNNLIPPGFVGRWVSGYTLDPNGGRHASNYKEQVLRQMWHAQPVREPVYDADGNKTGETRPKTGLLGKAMMYPIEDYAKRVIRHSPWGAFDQVLDDQAEALDNMAHETNSAYGKRGGVVQSYVPEEMGDRSYSG